MKHVAALIAISLMFAASTSFAQAPKEMPAPPAMPPQMQQPMPMPHMMAPPAPAAADMTKGLIALGAGLAIGMAVIGGALGQGRAAAAALEGIARNPGASGKIFIPMLLALAFVESLVLYALLIAFWLQGKV
jgi:F-type H+-transporting ATPase subunit c